MKRNAHIYSNRTTTASELSLAFEEMIRAEPVAGMIFPVEDEVIVKGGQGGIFKANKLVFHPNGVLKFPAGLGMGGSSFSWNALVVEELAFFDKSANGKIISSTRYLDQDDITGQPGKDGKPGKSYEGLTAASGDGRHGGSGDPGKNGTRGSFFFPPTLFIYVKKIVVQQTSAPFMNLFIDMRGIDGGNGGKGGDGGKGGHGEKGQNGELDSFGLCKQGPRSGGPGGDGGQGGDGGYPGNGGPGGNIFIYAPYEAIEILKFANIFQEGGEGGRGGSWGIGVGGQGGDHGDRPGSPPRGCDGGSNGLAGDTKHGVDRSKMYGSKGDDGKTNYTIVSETDIDRLFQPL